MTQIKKWWRRLIGAYQYSKLKPWEKKVQDFIDCKEYYDARKK